MSTRLILISLLFHSPLWVMAVTGDLDAARGFSRQARAFKHFHQAGPVDPRGKVRKMFLRYQFIVLLDADVAVFPQCELAVPTGIQVGDQRFHDFAPAVFIPNARIDGALLGGILASSSCSVPALDRGTILSRSHLMVASWPNVMSAWSNPSTL